MATNAPLAVSSKVCVLCKKIHAITISTIKFFHSFYHWSTKLVSMLWSFFWTNSPKNVHDLITTNFVQTATAARGSLMGEDFSAWVIHPPPSLSAACIACWELRMRRLYATVPYSTYVCTKYKMTNDWLTIKLQEHKCRNFNPSYLEECCYNQHLTVM